MVKVRVSVFGVLREKVGFKELEIELGGSNPKLIDLLNKLPKLKKWVVDDSGGLRDGFIVLINGIHAQFRGGLNCELRDGDEVSVFPPGAGG